MCLFILPILKIPATTESWSVNWTIDLIFVLSEINNTLLETEYLFTFYKKSSDQIYMENRFTENLRNFSK